MVYNLTYEGLLGCEWAGLGFNDGCGKANIHIAYPLPLCAPPPDVDECAGDTNLCQQGQRCVNLLGSYNCLPSCRPGYRVTADGSSCEGD